MNEDQIQKTGQQNALDHAFVETAFTAEEIQRAIAEEELLGVRDVPCAFLGTDAGK